MEEKGRKKVLINDVTKRFVEAVETLKDKGFLKYRDIAESIGWNDTALSNVRKFRINAPIEYVETFEKVYKIPVISKIDDSDIQNRLLRIEATLEVYGISIAGLKTKKIEDFEDRFSELQKLVSEAVQRRKMESGE